jgi:hypothetical protein
LAGRLWGIGGGRQSKKVNTTYLNITSENL